MAVTMCINRNIMECKERCSEVDYGRTFSINRNIMECKDGYATFGDPVEFVLIETLWNVKTSSQLLHG